jgi:putative oxygen-independent coproporphyrinogen III oxidase
MRSATVRSPSQSLSRRLAMAENWQTAGFGIYVHWPYCLSKCPYCDFNSHVAASIDHDEWRLAYVAALRSWSNVVGQRVVKSVFFGGGTPSLMNPGTVASILDTIATSWDLANDVEITLEANPTSVEAGRLTAFRQAGVNRVSLGLQSLDDRDLTRLGRTHSATEGLAALDIARATFDRVSFDLIYARQDQTLEDWTSELARALGSAPDHLSLYQLTIEDGTVFGRRHTQGRLSGLPSDDLASDMYQATQEICAAAGLPAYEVSNHATPGAESRHNLVYWRGGDWLGIGPGAHGRLDLEGRRMSTETPRDPGKWLSIAGAEANLCQKSPIAPIDAAEEYLMMSLRLAEGLDMHRYAHLGGPALSASAIDDLVSHGLLQEIEGRLIATPRGRMVLNAIIRDLIVGGT